MKNGRYEEADESIRWYIEGKLHREDGPALENESEKVWYLNDIELTEQEFNRWLDKKNLNKNLKQSLPPKSIEKRVKI